MYCICSGASRPKYIATLPCQSPDRLIDASKLAVVVAGARVDDVRWDFPVRRVILWRVGYLIFEHEKCCT